MRDTSPETLVRDGYNAIAAEYLKTREESPGGVTYLDEFVFRLAPGAKVLDAGCGAGVPIARVLSQSFDVTGVDFSETQIGIARQLVPEAKFICQDMMALTFSDSSFDGICSYYAIINIPREKHRGLLSGFHRMLKPGGLALLCMGAGDLPGDVNEDWLGAPMYWSHYDAETNLQMVKDCGFAVLSSEVAPDNFTEPPAKHLFVLAEKR